MRYRNFVQCVAILLLLALQIPGAALAHDGPARIELNRQQTSSGAELEIRGVNIAPDQPIVLALIGANDEYPLGTAVGDIHGDFVIGVRLPAEALAGAYTVRAMGANRVIVAAPLTLVGSANEEGSERRDQSELALAPVPQPARAAPAQPPAAPAPQAAVIVPPAPAASRPSVPLWMLGGVLAAIVAGLAVLLRRRGTSRGVARP